MSLTEIVQLIANVSTAIAVCGLVLQIRQQRKDAKNRLDDTSRETFQVLYTAFASEEASRLRLEFLALLDHPEPLASYTGSRSREAQIVRRILNNYELLAIFGRKGLIDMDLVGMFARNFVIRDFNRCDEFIKSESKLMDEPSIWSEAKLMATTWACAPKS